MKKFKQVSSDDHQMSVAGGGRICGRNGSGRVSGRGGRIIWERVGPQGE